MTIKILFHQIYHNPGHPSIEGDFYSPNWNKIESGLVPGDHLFSKINKSGRAIVPRDSQLLLLMTYTRLFISIYISKYIYLKIIICRHHYKYFS